MKIFAVKLRKTIKGRFCRLAVSLKGSQMLSQTIITMRGRCTEHDHGGMCPVRPVEFCGWFTDLPDNGSAGGFCITESLANCSPGDGDDGQGERVGSVLTIPIAALKWLAGRTLQRHNQSWEIGSIGCGWFWRTGGIDANRAQHLIGKGLKGNCFIV